MEDVITSGLKQQQKTGTRWNSDDWLAWRVSQNTKAQKEIDARTRKAQKESGFYKPHMLTKKDTEIAMRLNKVTANDTIETRIAEAQRNAEKKQKATERLDELYREEKNGQTEEEFFAEREEAIKKTQRILSEMYGE